MRRQDADDRERENAVRRESKLGEIVGSLRPLYYAGVGFGIGLVAGELFGKNVEPALVMGFGYNAIDYISRKPDNKMTTKEAIIVYMGCTIGVVIEKMMGG